MTANLAQPGHASPGPEWRMVSVVFADMVDSMTLSARIDAEELRDVFVAWREAATRAIDARGGTVARFVGDGLLAYFGYPAAHEDDARRAVDAALDVIAATRALPPVAGAPIRVRCAVHSGVVVVGDLGRGAAEEKMAVVGDVPNLAARLQSVADPDQVVITADTHEIAGRWFHCLDAGAVPLKGVAEPVRAWRVEGRARPDGGLAVWRRADLPLTGRDQELATLREHWRRARGGRGQLLLIEGDPGLGKSRLAREFLAGAEGEPTILIGRCAQDRAASALQPLVEILEAQFGIGPDDPASVRAARLATALRARGDRAETAELETVLAPLLGARAEGEPDADGGPAERRRLFDGLNGWLLGLARERPVVLVIEDLHWADESTCDWLASVTPLLEHAPILALVMSRPGPAATSLAALRTTRLALDRLSLDEARALVRACEGGATLPAAAVDDIAARCDGVPLFVEEMSRAVVAAARRGVSPGDELQIPLTLQDLLAARLDELGRHRPVAQLAAVLGRRFDFALLEACWTGTAAELEAACAALVAMGFVLRQPSAGGPAYVFRHALIQDACYRSMLRKLRVELHRRVADALETRFPARAESAPDVVGRHHLKGQRFDAASRAFAAAARRAAERSANAEAVEQYRRALAALRQLPAGPERDPSELELLVAQGWQLIAARGNAAPEVHAVYEEARRIAERVADTPLRFRVLRGLQSFYIVRGEVRLAREVGNQIIRQAERSNDGDLRLQALRSHGLTLAYLGELVAARQHLSAALELYDPVRHEHHRFAYSSDPGVLAACQLGWVEWLLGRPTVARDHARAAIAAADRLDHRHSQCFALCLAASLQQFDADPAGARALAKRAKTIADQADYPYWSAWSRLLLGWSDAMAGSDVGLGEMEQAMAMYAETGAMLMRPYFLGALAEARARTGRRDDALADVDTALSVARSTGVRFYEPELARLRAQLLADDDPAEARAELQRGLDLAREQNSLAMELRLLVALASGTDATASAHRDALSACVGRFAATDESADLARARRLLAE